MAEDSLGAAARDRLLVQGLDEMRSQVQSARKQRSGAQHCHERPRDPQTLTPCVSNAFQRFRRLGLCKTGHAPQLSAVLPACTKAFERRCQVLRALLGALRCERHGAVPRR